MSCKTKAKVLMAGPGLSLKGGIVSVVKGYQEAGIAARCKDFRYLGTIQGTAAAAKAATFGMALCKFRMIVDRYDVVHLHTSKGGSLKRKTMLAKIAAEHGKKVILHEHNGEFRRDFEAGDHAYRGGVRAAFDVADKVVVLSEEWRDYFADNVCPADKLVVAHNGVAVPAMPCEPCSRQDVLFLGRLDANKSPDVLLRASREVLKTHQGMRLLFGGDGYPERYEALARELGIAENCEFLGWVSGDAKEELYQRAGVYCLPSKHEGMPMGVLEAMAHGIPTVATPVGGVPQIIRDGENGLLVPVDDVEGLSRALCCLVDSPSLRQELGSAGRETVKNEFCVDSCVDKLVCLYEELTR